MAMNDPRNLEDANSEVEKIFNELGPKRYSHEDLKKLTSNFSESNIVGFGGYGVVYKGQFPAGGVQVAVKVLGPKDVVEETFMAEVSTMGNTNHRNLMKLKGYCYEPNMKALVCEYMENGSLDMILYKPGSSIEWEKLYLIAIEIAEGLAYLHGGSNGKIIHYDIKAGNVLLDKNLSPKITDFGLAKIMEKDVSRVPLSRIRGTVGYNAPETWMPGSQVTYKCDVYSFGMMMFEVLGKRNNGEGEDWFPGIVWDNSESGQLEYVLDYIGIAEENRENAKLLSKVALWCIQFNPEERPTMKEVVLMLEKRIQVEMPSNPFPYWQSSKSSILPSIEVISEDNLEGSYGIDARTIQEAKSSLFSLEGNIPGSTDSVSAEEESQVTFQPSTVKDGVKANGTLSACLWEWLTLVVDWTLLRTFKKSPGKLIYSNGGSNKVTWENVVGEAHGKFTYENGDCYEGTLRNSKRDGQGRYVWANGDEYIGELKNDVLEGHGKFTCENGDYYEGTFKNMSKDGRGRYVWANGDEYIGEYVNGVREGQGKLTHHNGEYYEGTFRNSIKEGQGKYVLPNSYEYTGEWKNDLRHGQGRCAYINGDVHVGEWKNDAVEGHGKFTCKNGDYYEGEFSRSTSKN